MNELLASNPLLLLFIVAAVGYLVGKINFKGSSLGVSAVLFVGLAFGAYNPNFNVPFIVFQLGLVLFVYSVGLSSGPAFFQSFKKNGWRDIGFVITMLTMTALLAAGIFYICGLDAATITGVYSGSTTNTPALASVIEMIRVRNYEGIDALSQALTVGYTFSYPMGVIGVMFILKAMEKLLKIDYNKEYQELKKHYPLEDDLTSRSIVVTNAGINKLTLRDLLAKVDANVLFGRVISGDDESLAHWDTRLKVDDVLMVIGSAADIDSIQTLIGKESSKNISYDRKEYDVRQIFVSNPQLVGRSLASLNLSEKYQAIITRIRRGDIEMLANADTILEMGDRIRFVARRKDLKALSTLFGDSYFKSSQVNLFSFGLGIALGLLLGSIEFTLPGDVNFKLGLAGGPLVMGLFLGALRRTGPVVWTLPYSANVTLRQMGLIFLLAVIGLSSGNTFKSVLGGGDWMMVFLAGTILSMLATLLSVVIGYRFFKIPFSLLLGFLSNQPAIVEFAQDMSKNKVPLIGYSLMFPIALVTKILYAQILFLWLSNW